MQNSGENLRNSHTKKGGGRGAFLLPTAFFGLCFLRFCYYGLCYLPMLDDSIQYHNYAFFGKGLFAEIERLGLLSARPLAGVADIAIWSNFFGNLMAAIFIITLLFTLAAYFFSEAFKESFGITPIFYAVLLLTPLNFEGSYWLSASSRVVVGIFFCALAAYFFSRYIKNGRARFIPLFALSALLACGFYEQTLVMSVAAPVLLALANLKKLRARAAFSLLSVANVGLYFLFTKGVSNSLLYAVRAADFILPFSNKFYNERVFPALLEQLKHAFLSAPFYIHTKGFVRGAKELVLAPNFIYILLLVLLICAVVVFSLRCKDREGVAPKVWGIAVGLCLAVAPIAPFFVIANPWISLRAVCCSLPGIALVIDRVIALILYKVGARRAVTAGLCAAMSAFFMVGSISELHDYRRTMEDDGRICDSIIRSVGGYRGGEKVAVLGLLPSYLEEQNYYHNEHIHGVTESDWALSAALSCRTEDRIFPKAVPYPFGDISDKLKDFEKSGLYLFADENGDTVLLSHSGDEFFDGDRRVAHLQRDGENVFLVSG